MYVPFTPYPHKYLSLIPWSHVSRLENPEFGNLKNGSSSFNTGYFQDDVCGCCCCLWHQYHRNVVLPVEETSVRNSVVSVMDSGGISLYWFGQQNRQYVKYADHTCYQSGCTYEVLHGVFLDEMLNTDNIKFSCVGFQYSCSIVSDPGASFPSTTGTSYVSFMSDTCRRFLVLRNSQWLVSKHELVPAFLKIPDLYLCCSSMLALVPTSQSTSFSIVPVLQYNLLI